MMSAYYGFAKTVLEFTEMMELLLGAGLSLRDALEIVTLAGKKSGTGLLGKRLLDRIRRGASFAGAIQTMEDIFPPIYRGMIKVGDAAGSVERIFPRLSAYMRDQKKLRDKTAGALAYPVLILIVSILGAAGLAFFIIPKMETIFSGFGGNAVEKIHANIRSIKIFLTLLFSVILLVVFGLISLRGMAETNKDLACFLDYQVLRIPVIGNFIASWETLNFTFAMEVLTGGGISVESAIEEAGKLVFNRAYRRSLSLVQDKVLNGGSLSLAFSEEKTFPPCMSQWISVGERSGKTEKIFSQIRSYFQDEIEQRISQFLLLIEPIMITAVGLIILGLVAGIILPLFSIYGTII
jgi:type II secretory pathway component PulF